MINPFEQLQDKLEEIEKLLRCISGEQPRKRMLKIEEVSERLGYSRSTIYYKTSRNEIPYYKVGNRLFFDAEEIEHWIKNQGQ